MLLSESFFVAVANSRNLNSAEVAVLINALINSDLVSIFIDELNVF